MAVVLPKGWGRRLASSSVQGFLRDPGEVLAPLALVERVPTPGSWMADATADSAARCHFTLAFRPAVEVGIGPGEASKASPLWSK